MNTHPHGHTRTSDPSKLSGIPTLTISNYSASHSQPVQGCSAVLAIKYMLQNLTSSSSLVSVPPPRTAPTAAAAAEYRCLPFSCPPQSSALLLRLPSALVFPDATQLPSDFDGGDPPATVAAAVRAAPRTATAVPISTTEAGRAAFLYRRLRFSLSSLHMLEQLQQVRIIVIVWQASPSDGIIFPSSTDTNPRPSRPSLISIRITPYLHVGNALSLPP